MTETDLTTLLKTLSISERPGRYCFVDISDVKPGVVPAVTIKEEEGMTAVVLVEEVLRVEPEFVSHVSRGRSNIVQRARWEGARSHPCAAPRCAAGDRRGRRTGPPARSLNEGDGKTQVQSDRQDSRHVAEAFRHDAPPHPPASLLAGDESRLGQDPGVVRDGRLALAQRLLQGAATDLRLGRNQ